MAYNSLSTANLPDPGVDPNAGKEPRDYFETFLYTGNGTGLQVGDVIKKPADTTTISNSLIFDDGDSPYLSYTPSTSGDQKKWTFSAWVKRGVLGTQQGIFSGSSYSGNDGIAALYFYTDDTLYTYYDTSGTNPVGAVGSSAFKDTSTWYHIVWAVDAANTEHKIWVNGLLVSTVTGVYPPNFSYGMNRSGTAMGLGTKIWGPSSSLDGYMAEVHYCDGQYLDASDFGNFDANGIWIPKAVTGITYGTNGFYLDFSDNTSTTTLGEDQTANGNDWTLNNMATTDQVAESPTDNCVLHLNPSTATTHTISEGNLKTTNTSGTHGGAVCNRAYFSGKWYHEVKILAETSDKGQGVGIGNRVTRNTTEWGNYTNIVAYMSDGTVHTAGGYSAFGNAHNTNDIIGVAYDHDARTLEFFHNGTSQGTLTESDFQSTIDWDDIAPLVFGRNVTQELNFGQRTLVHTPPTDYVTMTENNITVDDQNLESPDFVWIKNRDQADKHHLYDSVRGIQKAIYSNANTAETDEPNGLLDFNKNGFTVGSEVEVNTSGEDFVAWNWKAPTSFSNDASETGIGTIDSSGKVSTDSGFSIVSYTGDSTGTDGTASTVKHGLSQAPEMIMFKPLDTYDGAVYHSGLTSASYRLILFSASGTLAQSSDTGFFNGTAPTTSVFSIGSRKHTNSNGGMIAYCFHSVDGFSKIGTYEGNNSTDNAFVYTGFRPAWIMIKNIDAVGNWGIWDTKRNTYNVASEIQRADTSAAKATTSPNNDIDILSNGFKVRGDTGLSGDAVTYIYMAFAENPFKYSNAR